MKTLKKGNCYLVTIVEDNKIKKRLAVAFTSHLMQILLTGEILPTYKSGNIVEVQS